MVNNEAENVEAENEEMNEGENLEENAVWETQSEEQVVPKHVNDEPATPVQGGAEMKEKEVEVVEDPAAAIQKL
ncbi:hypothetical protein Dimus_033321 [Dionaea muscipula]